MTKDYRNMNLMQAVGIALSGWKENLGSNEYGELDDAHKQITVNAVAKAIGECAFVGCGNLKRVSFPDDNHFVAYGLFAYCNKLAEVKLSPNTQTVSTYAFSN